MREKIRKRIEAATAARIAGKPFKPEPQRKIRPIVVSTPWGAAVTSIYKLNLFIEGKL